MDTPDPNQAQKQWEYYPIITTKVPIPPKTFEQELSALINRFSKENDSNTPDFILAEYMQGALDAFTKAVVRREEWYGRKVFRYGSAPQNVEVYNG